MTKSMMEVIMNPARQRIAQYLLLHKRGTTNDIAKELSDIPKPSLYRHLKLMAETGLIQVVEEKKVRGTIEKTYGLVENPIGSEPTNDEIANLIQKGLLSLMNDFQIYFQREDADPKRDLLSFTTSTLLLTDEEYMAFMKEIAQILNKIISNKPENGRKVRRISFVSSPGMEKE